jgi:hypothetical protein
MVKVSRMQLRLIDIIFSLLEKKGRLIVPSAGANLGELFPVGLRVAGVWAARSGSFACETLPP